MSCIYKDKHGSYLYVYEVTAYRNADGRTRNRKEPIGRVDQESGLVIYKEEYLQCLQRDGLPVPDDAWQDTPPTVSDDDWMSVAAEGIDAARAYGSEFLLREVAKRTGMLSILQQTFPNIWVKLLGLASFLIEPNDSALSNYADWAAGRALPRAVVMSSQRISELLSQIDEDRCNRFYAEWISRQPQSEYTALDVTSISSYSELMDDVDKGYNRDHERLPQLNVCMAFGEESKLPLYQTAYNGSIPDVRRLQNTLDEIRALVPGRLLRVVMDKGFYSEENVQEMLNLTGFRFLLAAPFSSGFIQDQADAVRDTVQDVENTVLEASHALFGLHKVRRFPGRTERVHVFVYFNPHTANKARMELPRGRNTSA